MKEIFPGYYKKTETDLKKMWKEGIILFDANVLLNLYRYSDSTCETLLKLISRFGEQIYLPHQAALEYNRNRYEVIAEQEKAYREFREKITQIQKDIQSVTKHPFLSEALDKDLHSVFERVNKEVQESIEKYNKYLKEDPIYNKLSSLFKERITGSFSEEEIIQIYKEGEERYKLKIPPGFEDEKTKDSDKKFGDLILWKQIIAQAKDLKKDVILITDERKIDWWWIIKDQRNMGPRHELVEEIYKLANVDFHMYSSERFLTYGKTILNEKIDQQALDEIQAMQEEELWKLKKGRILERMRSKRGIRSDEEYISIRNRLEELNNKQISINQHINQLRDNPQHNDEFQHYLRSISIYETQLRAEAMTLEQRLNSYQTNSENNDESFNRLKARYPKYFKDENGIQ